MVEQQAITGKVLWPGGKAGNLETPGKTLEKPGKTWKNMEKNLEPGKWVEEMVHGKHMMGKCWELIWNGWKFSTFQPAFGWILGSGDEQMESLSQT